MKTDPNESINFVNIDIPNYDSGLTKREYFAAKNTAAIVSSIDSEDNYSRLRSLAKEKGINVSQWIAKEAVKQADATIDALNGESELERFKSVLEAIANPIEHLRKEAEKDGRVLDGAGAFALATNAQWLQKMAKNALNK